MYGKDFVSINDLTSDEVKATLDLGMDLRANPEHYHEHLKQKTLAMVFEKPSLRTRVTFETGMTQLGGHAIYLAPSDISLGKRESVPDVARNLERWVDCVMARVFEHNKVVELAEFGSMPVINGLSDDLHPCQVMADLLTLRGKWDSLAGKKMTYVGDGNNMAHSLMIGAAKVGMHITIATPKGYEPREEFVELARKIGEETGAQVEVTNDHIAGVKDADSIYTDAWASMGQESEAAARRKIFAEYQVNEDLFSHAKEECFFMHCLPAHRGEEVTDDVMDGWRSLVFDQAENRLHAHKAIMLMLMSEEFSLRE